MLSHTRKLDEKTEILHLSSRFVPSDQLPPLKIGESFINPSTEARNLGVVFDSSLQMKTHINNTCRAGWAFI